MSAPKHPINVRIGKMTYQLMTTDDPQKMRDIAVTADAMIARVAKRQPHLNHVSQAVLALVNAVGMIEMAHDQLESARDDRDMATRAAEETKAELIRLREQFWQLKKELLYYQNLCEIHETKRASRSSQNEEGDKTDRRYRRTGRTQMGDYQVTIEETLPPEPEDEKSIDELTRTPVLEDKDDDA